MTDHIHGENSYVECDRYHVVWVRRYKDLHSNLPPELSVRRNCYCGEKATHIARVGFFTTVEERDRYWNRIRRQTFKAHRCDEHGFEK